MGHKKIVVVMNDQTFYLKTYNETSKEIVKSKLGYMGRELFMLMESELPDLLSEKMKNPEQLIIELEKLQEMYMEKGKTLIACGMNYLEAMEESRQYVAAMLNL